MKTSLLICLALFLAYVHSQEYSYERNYHKEKHSRTIDIDLDGGNDYDYNSPLRGKRGSGEITIERHRKTHKTTRTIEIETDGGADLNSALAEAKRLGLLTGEVSVVASKSGGSSLSGQGSEVVIEKNSHKHRRTTTIEIEGGEGGSDLNSILSEIKKRGLLSGEVSVVTNKQGGSSNNNGGIVIEHTRKTHKQTHTVDIEVDGGADVNSALLEAKRLGLLGKSEVRVVSSGGSLSGGQGSEVLYEKNSHKESHKRTITVEVDGDSDVDLNSALAEVKRRGLLSGGEMTIVSSSHGSHSSGSSSSSGGDYIDLPASHPSAKSATYNSKENVTHVWSSDRGYYDLPGDQVKSILKN